MIRAMKENDLQAADFSEIKHMVTTGKDWPHWISEQDISSASKEIDKIRKLSPKVRAVIASYLNTGALFCVECGATSCVHGYRDV